MKNLFVPYALALKAKEAGFNEKCLTYYGFNTKLKSISGGWFVNNAMTGKQCTASTWQQLIDWFREKHEIVIQSNVYQPHFGGIIIPLYVSPAGSEVHYTKYYMDYYKMQTIAIEKAFELIKK